MASSEHKQLVLQASVTCPHCWNRFAPEEALWIAEHPDLLGDERLGSEFPRRFLPSRFTWQGDAIDSKGEPCTRLACPRCHLEVPRALFEVPPVFYSILGAPACGKSYFLASMIWALRHSLPERFHISLNDTDPQANKRLHDYEGQQFLSDRPDDLVALAKTETQGDLYDTVQMSGYSMLLPRPFMFTLRPLQRHPNYRQSRLISRVLTLYDNAGESFLPGTDVAAAPVTRHLARSSCLFFLFDPTQDSRFRDACEGQTADPQMLSRLRSDRESSVRQDSILCEAIQRVRRHAGLREGDQHQRPLVVVVTKWDSWKSLIPTLDTSPPYVPIPDADLFALDLPRIQETSNRVRELLRRLTPEILAAAEGFSKDLYFIPVSATGAAPERDPETGALGLRPRDIRPFWVEVPMLMALSNWEAGLIGSLSSKVSHVGQS